MSKPKNCYYCANCIVQDNVKDFVCAVTEHMVIENYKITEHFGECEGKEFIKE